MTAPCQRVGEEFAHVFKKPCRYMRAIRGIPGLHVKAYAGSPEASSVAIKFEKWARRI